ncbi:CPBP family glutamic-type intramembrane protease [Erythrobacter sp. SDW2]|uniref:CPBP family glutamic-type intramembrane protease n=1 Tax=Erythrobacter sp. SDW2 TaxID=2907154 RepID=UPI001F491F75|nr:CPBP family glutamic-type intramembrane protease [Erythrobacter sp. SDW2]UIP07043.1 CPBP family glutamic-type intramembrane protease [Erythrobacter sp. SDW2]
MSADETSQLAPAPTLWAEWGRYRSFVRRPTLPQRAAPLSGASLIAAWRLAALDLTVAGGLILLAMAATFGGFDPPSHALDGLSWTPEIVLAIVVIAPLTEELFFRGWLSGRPDAVSPVILLGMAAVALVFAGKDNALAAAGVAGVAVLAALALAFVLRKRPAWGWFTRAFPLFFWLSTTAFALVHLLNYEEGSLAMLLPLVLPQFIAGSIFGYARVTYGLWASMLLHVLHNGALVGGIALALRHAG